MTSYAPIVPRWPLVVLLQLLQTLAALYLPTLNADIIDYGVVKGDMGYILRIGGVMIVVSMVQIVCSAGAGALWRAYGDGSRPGRPGRGLPSSAEVLRP